MASIDESHSAHNPARPGAKSPGGPPTSSAGSSAEPKRSPKHADENLEDLYRTLPGFFFRIRCAANGGSAQVEHVGSRVADFFGIDAPRIVADPSVAWNMVHSQDRAALRTIAAEHDRRGPFDLDVRVVAADGQTRWLNLHANGERQASNEVVIRGVAVDVTARKAAEEALRRSHRQGEAHALRHAQELSSTNERLLQEVADRKQAEQERQKFASLVEHSGDFIALVDMQGRLLFVNAAGRALVGLTHDEDVSGRRLAEFLPPASARHWNDVELPAVISQGDWTGERQLFNARSGQELDMLVNSFLVGDAESQLPLCVATVERDITDRKRSEASIRTSEERFRQLADNIDEAFWISDLEPRRILYISPAYSTMWGRSRESLYEDPDSFLEGVHPDDRPRIEESLPRTRSEGYEEVYRVVHTDGSIRTVRVRAFPVRNEQGAVYRVAGIIEDITKDRQIEDELIAERRFLEHLLHVQEGERKLIAYDIHDGFVQSVIGALMHLEGLEGDPGVLPATREKLKVPQSLLRDSIDEARRMISGLRPPIIDEQGVVAAIEYLINEAPGQATKVTFRHDVDFVRLDAVLEGTLFRIVQEALTNVERHSKAPTAEVRLSQHGDRLSLVIEDSGIGFDPLTVTDRRFGLRGIRERARLLGGTADITSAPGRGTTVQVELPLKSALGHA